MELRGKLSMLIHNAMFTWLGSAPFFSSTSTTSVYPFWLATCSALEPSWTVDDKRHTCNVLMHTYSHLFHFQMGIHKQLHLFYTYKDTGMVHVMMLLHLAVLILQLTENAPYLLVEVNWQTEYYYSLAASAHIVHICTHNKPTTSQMLTSACCFSSTLTTSTWLVVEAM